MTPNLLTAADMATLLNAEDEKQVKEWHRRYHWPHVKLGREVRWTAEQATEIVRRHTVTVKATALEDDGRTARSKARGRS